MSGEGVDAMRAEAGGHRIQRCPATERNGRVHSSTVTVAVLDACDASDPVPLTRPMSEFSVEWFSGQGAGGQHRNKHQNSCKLKHIATGMMRAAQTRSRANSLAEAFATLNADLDRLEAGDRSASANIDRRAQVGTGERSDRRRVWAFQRDAVEDLRTGKRMRCVQALRGDLDRLW